MENIENKLGINEDGCSNLEAKSEGKSGDRDELERKSYFMHHELCIVLAQDGNKGLHQAI